MMVEKQAQYSLSQQDSDVSLVDDVFFNDFSAVSDGEIVVSEEGDIDAVEDSNDLNLGNLEGLGETVVLELQEDGGEPQELVFSLPIVPGADDESDIVVDEDEDLEVDESVIDMGDASKDRWDWQSGGLGVFLQWVHDMMRDVPRHSGKDTTGLEKAIAYFEALDKEITKAMRTDYRDEIDSAKAEEARSQIEDGLDRLTDRLEKVRTSKYKRHAKKSKKKKAYESQELLVKQAQKATQINGIVVTVPLFISHLARICINGMVSAGHDIEDMYTKLAKRYNLTPREKAEFVQLLSDMNYPIRLDRGYIGDEDNYDPKRSDNFDHAANFTG